MICNRINIDSDLSESSLSEACSRLYGDAQRSLHVPTALLLEGVKLAKLKGLVLRLDTDLPRDAWYVINDWQGIFSPGA